METKIRVLIADPNEDFQLMMSEILGEEEDITVVGSAGDGLETLAYCGNCRSCAKLRRC